MQLNFNQRVRSFHIGLKHSLGGELVMRVLVRLLTCAATISFSPLHAHGQTIIPVLAIPGGIPVPCSFDVTLTCVKPIIATIIVGNGAITVIPTGFISNGQLTVYLVKRMSGSLLKFAGSPNSLVDSVTQSFRLFWNRPYTF